MDLLRIGELDPNYKSDFLPDKKKEKKSSAASAGSQLVGIGIAALWKSGKKKQKNTAFCCVVQCSFGEISRLFHNLRWTKAELKRRVCTEKQNPLSDLTNSKRTDID